MLEKILEKTFDKIPIEILWGIGLACVVLAISLTFFAKPKAEMISTIMNVPITNINGICIEEKGISDCISLQVPKKGTLSVIEPTFQGGQTYIKFKTEQ